jgi:hypothetical protein
LLDLSGKGIKERWLSGRKRRIANPMYDYIIPRVRISSSPN